MSKRLVTAKPTFWTRRWKRVEKIGDILSLERQLREDLSIENRPKLSTGRVMDSYELVVSCDSQVKGRYTTFVTAVVVKPLGQGAWGYYWRAKTPAMRPVETEKRLWEEVELISQIANEVRALEDDVPNVQLWTEIDFNGTKDTRSHKVLPAAEGFLKGQGFRVRAKPKAWCATFYAGRLTT